jgi:hypothetical protein
MNISKQVITTFEYEGSENSFNVQSFDFPSSVANAQISKFLNDLETPDFWIKLIDMAFIDSEHIGWEVSPDGGLYPKYFSTVGLGLTLDLSTAFSILISLQKVRWIDSDIPVDMFGGVSAIDDLEDVFGGVSAIDDLEDVFGAAVYAIVFNANNKMISKFMSSVKDLDFVMCNENYLKDCYLSALNIQQIII